MFILKKKKRFRIIKPAYILFYNLIGHQLTPFYIILKFPNYNLNENTSTRNSSTKLLYTSIYEQAYFLFDRGKQSTVIEQYFHCIF